MDLRRWPKADALLDRALDLPPDERRPFVHRESGGDPELIAALEAILNEADLNDAFLSPAAGAGGSVMSAAWAAAGLDEAPALQPGERFTSYEVLELAGSGGMGEVYRARDERLGRLVALKVLPKAFVEDRQRLARFDREARLLASLNHPNIAAIYGLAEDGGRQALVLEFVEGTTLADRLSQGALPIEPALSIARQVALALEAAHRRGIVHRDLKPGNISLTSDGTVKVLDFGLAKAIGGADDVPASAAGLTSVVIPGSVLGTPAYMAPEQARGAGVDRRADVWAFGCVLYEMLTGARAFAGDTANEVIARVLEREPDLGKLPPDTPEPIHRLLRRALTKDPKRRLADIADAVLDIEDAERDGPRGGIAARLRTWGTPATRIAALVVILLAGVAGGVLLPRAFNPGAPDPLVVRLALPVPASDDLLLSAQQVAALSPDGRTIVYRAVRDGTVRLFRRSLGGLTSDPIAGTENAAGPFFSPDGAWLGFDGDGVLQKVSLAGGAPITICEAPGGATASWGGDTIVFSTATARVLHRVAGGGGPPERLTELDVEAGDIAHTFPHVMPSGDAALFTVIRADGRHVAIVRIETREVRLLTGGSQPRYHTSGHLLFVRSDSLWAAPFDERRLEITGAAVPVLEGLETAADSAAHFAAGADGSLVYVPRREEIPERRLVWIDRHGNETLLELQPKRFTRATLSPDGGRIAFASNEQGNTDVWIAHLQDGTILRLTRDPTIETTPLWSPDGRSVVFRSDREGGGLFRRAADVTGAIERITSSGPTLHTPHSWTPDGRTLLFTEFRSYTQQAIAAAVPGSTDDYRRLLDGGFAQLRPQVSPDGQWVAYQSDESGRFEIYVRPFPGMDEARWQVTTGGATSPRWSKDGSELFYYDGRGIVSAAVIAGRAFSTGEHRRLFEYAPFGGRLGPDYDVTPDGRRFLMIRSAVETPSTRVQLVVVQNWISELRAKLGQ